MGPPCRGPQCRTKCRYPYRKGVVGGHLCRAVVVVRGCLLPSSPPGTDDYEGHHSKYGSVRIPPYLPVPSPHDPPEAPSSSRVLCSCLDGATGGYGEMYLRWEGGDRGKRVRTNRRDPMGCPEARGLRVVVGTHVKSLTEHGRDAG